MGGFSARVKERRRHDEFYSLERVRVVVQRGSVMGADDACIQGAANSGWKAGFERDLASYGDCVLGYRSS